MKIFLTGGTGFLGKAIKNLIPDYDYYLYKRGDDVTKKLKKFKPDIVIHSAGEIYKNEEMFNSNIVLTNDILNYVKDNDVSKMLYFGSSSEYGKKEDPMKETDLCDPETIYAATKTAGTLMCQAYAKTYDKDICVVRPFSIYGIYEPEHRLIPTLYRKIKNGEKIQLIKGTHDFFYIKDFVRFINLLLISDKEKTKAKVLNAGSGVSYTNPEVADTFSKVMGIPVVYDLLDKRKECDSAFWKADISKINKEFHFKPFFTLEQGLKDYSDFKNLS